ncbi:hypothetical protein ACFPAF_15155 [Hymenobacter endophyticus]|uniref:Uncharacterized protein n=1 Tax=Hymenobacter endophyticus TaxID=3076335 RepID=A0ABU3TK35_9BACT|nr:hypothetical protein [Hymenobacter endophyticus]MDU0371739.1 hypothetical protein [Hymenobacter endophyticus]
MVLRLFKLSLILFALSFCLPNQVSAAGLFGGRFLPTVKAKLRGYSHVHRPNYRLYRPYHR